jgi:hypothetical protein
MSRPKRLDFEASGLLLGIVRQYRMSAVRQALDDSKAISLARRLARADELAGKRGKG